MTDPKNLSFSAALEQLIRHYRKSILGVEEKADREDGRAYGGVIRSDKGKLVEEMADYIIGLAWEMAGGPLDRLSINEPDKSYRLPIRREYVDGLPLEVREHILPRLKSYHYRIQVDRLVFVDGAIVMGVECKAYAENAMLKRILVDFDLLRSLHPKLICCLLQLESQLGGDYSDAPYGTPPLGSPSTHTLMSYFPGVDLNIMTLLEGERKVDRPIHKNEFFKEMRLERLRQTVEHFSTLLSSFV